MRYHWGLGVGHVYSHCSPPATGDDHDMLLGDKNKDSNLDTTNDNSSENSRRIVCLTSDVDRAESSDPVTIQGRSENLPVGATHVPNQDDRLYQQHRGFAGKQSFVESALIDDETADTMDDAQHDALEEDIVYQHGQRRLRSDDDSSDSGDTESEDEGGVEEVWEDLEVEVEFDKMYGDAQDQHLISYD